MKRILHILSVSLFLLSCGSNSDLDSSAFCDGDILIPFQDKKDKDWGFININGEVIIDPEFDFQPSYAVNGLALMQDQSKDGEMYYRFIKIEDGKAVESDGKWDMAGEFREGLAPVRKKNEKVRFINEEFKEVFTVDAEKVSYFNEGRAAICNKDNKWGFIDKSGKEVIKPQYDFVQYGFRDGYAIVGKNSKDGKQFMLIDENGGVKLNMKDKYENVLSFSNGLIKIQDDDQFGFIDIDGNKVIKMNDEWGFVTDFINGYASFMEDNEWGLIDVKGNKVFKAKYDFPLFTFDDKIWFKEDDEWGLMDLEGNEIIKPEFDGRNYPFPFMCSTTIVQDGEDYIFIDKDGKEINQNEYENVAAFNAKYILGEPWNEVFESDYFDTGIVKGLIDANLLQIKTAEKFASTFELNPLLFWGKYDRSYRELDGKYQFYASSSSVYDFVAYQYDYSKDRVEDLEPEFDSEEYADDEEYYGEDVYDEEENYEVAEEEIESKYPLASPNGIESISYRFSFDDYLGITQKMSLDVANEYYMRDISEKQLFLNKTAKVSFIRAVVTLNKTGSGKAALVAESISSNWKGFIRKEKVTKEKDYYKIEGEITDGKINIRTNGSNTIIIEIEYNSQE